MIPESYIFLMKIRNYGKAARAACQYRRIDIQGFRDLVASHWQMEAEGALMEKRQSKASKQPRTIPLKERLGEQPPGLCKPLRCNRPVEDESGNVQTPSDTHLSGPTRRTKGKMRAYPLQTSPTRESRRDGAGEPSSATHSAHRQSEDSEEREREIEWENQRTPCFHRYHMKEINFFHRLWQIVADPRCRRALISCGMVQLAQALCGINAFAFFSSSLIDANLSDNFPLNLGISFGVVNFTFGLLTPYLSDRLGRTTLLLGGLPFMTLFMFILASVIVESNPAREPTVYLVNRGTSNQSELR